MADREISVRLHLQLQDYQAGLKIAANETASFGKQITGLEKNSAVNLEKIGKGALLMSGAMAAGMGLSIKAAVDWETAWAGVLKTVDGTDAELANLEAGLRNLAKELPASHTEIAGVAEAAGQLGISVGGVEKFTKTMIDLGETTTMSAEQAAMSLARFSNVMGTSESDIDRIGSTVVELGNNFATTEGEIVALSTRLAAAGRIAGLTEADVMAFAATLSSVGVSAEAGGTAVSKVFIAISDAVLDGSDKLDTFARVAGMSADEFSRAYEEDAAQAIASFVEGLGRMEASGESTTAVFGELALTDQRLMGALRSTAAAGDLLSESLEMGNTAWEQNTALQVEAELRYGTTAAQMDMLRNKVVDLGIDIGSVLVPMLNTAVEVLSTFAGGIAAMPGPMKTMLVGLTGITTAGLATVGIMATMIPKIQATRKALMQMGTAGQFLGRNMGRIAAGAGILAVGITTATWVIGRHQERVAKADARIRAWAEAIRDAGDAAGGTNIHIASIVAENKNLAAAMAEAEVTVADMSAALAEGGDAWDDMHAKLIHGADAAGIGGEAFFYLSKDLNQMSGEFEEATSQAENLDKVNADTDPTDVAADAMDDFGDALDNTADSADQLADAISAMMDEFDRLIGVNIDAMEATFDTIEGFNSLTETLKENGSSLDGNTQSGRDNIRAINDQVETIFKEIEARRKEGQAVSDVTSIAHGHVEALKQTMRQAGMTDDEITRYIDTLGLTPSNITTIVELSGVEGAESRLAHLARDRRARIDVDAGVYYTPGGGRHTLNAAQGGLVPNYLASGGIPELHPGRQRGTDTIPAWLTPGEFVVRKPAVDDIGLDRLMDLNRRGSDALDSRYMVAGSPTAAQTIDQSRISNTTWNVTTVPERMLADLDFFDRSKMAGV